jgi:CRP-like cAMP-binding protein
MDTHSLQNHDELIQKVKKMATFRSFEKKDFYRILNFSKIREYEPGETILEEGSYDNWIFFIISGKVRVVRHDREIGILGRTGDIFGEMGIIDGSPGPPPSPPLKRPSAWRRTSRSWIA